ncbi:DUF4158 domain-containing protein [Mesorhizobium sp. M1A.F.Ca.ET.072.01.1.1]|nr:DUF4158 domain-containing protein [Mesorhizobium sp. M1A.F.Ca.ET.072.01.1.1]TIV04798.1 MAG: DUF4158 domain-containing protein [Mesorhizobium sp.]
MEPFVCRHRIHERQAGRLEARTDGAAEVFRAFEYFATAAAEVPGEAVSYLADQLGVGETDFDGYDFSGRSGRHHCAEILRHLGCRRISVGSARR